MKSPQLQNSWAMWLYKLPKATSVGFSFPSLVNHNQQAWQTSLQRSLCITFMAYFLIHTSTWPCFLHTHHFSNFRRQGLAYLNTTCRLTQQDTGTNCRLIYNRTAGAITGMGGKAASANFPLSVWMQSYSWYLHHTGYLRQPWHLLCSKDTSTGRCPFITGTALGRYRNRTPTSIISLLQLHHPAPALKAWLWCQPLDFKMLPFFCVYPEEGSGAGSDLWLQR